MNLTQTKYDNIIELKEISRKLQRINEGAANGFGTPRAEQIANTKIKNHISRAIIISEQFGLVPYHNKDPRGCPLYLLTKEQETNKKYTEGIAIWFK